MGSKVLERRKAVAEKVQQNAVSQNGKQLEAALPLELAPQHENLEQKKHAVQVNAGGPHLDSGGARNSGGRRRGGGLPQSRDNAQCDACAQNCDACQHFHRMNQSLFPLNRHGEPPCYKDAGATGIKPAAPAKQLLW